MSEGYFVEPAGDHILVADIARETTIDGIVLPDNVRDRLFKRLNLDDYLKPLAK